jgi:carbonic anhydrase/acetyltransferase-like protein (isoleucine patch superfamily)
VFQKGKKMMKIDETVYVHPTAVIHAGSSVWAHSAIRGDFNSIKIGKFTSIQDTVVLHCAPMNAVVIGDYVTVGHGAVIHGAQIEDYVLVGMRAVILDGAHIGKGSLIAAGAVVREGAKVPPNSLVIGNPAVVKQAKEGTLERIKAGAISYHLLSRKYMEGEETLPFPELLAKMQEWKD